MTNKKDTRETIKNDKKAEKLPDPELKPESGNASGIIQNLLIFNSIRKDDDPACVTTNKTPRKIPVRGAAAGQKELSFEIELNSEDDPMVLVVQ